MLRLSITRNAPTLLHIPLSHGIRVRKLLCKTQTSKLYFADNVITLRIKQGHLSTVEVSSSDPFCITWLVRATTSS